MEDLKLSDISSKLSKNVIEKIFKIKTGSTKPFKSIEVYRATPKGEGLLSTVYRVRMSDSECIESLIVKAIVKDQLLRKSLSCGKYFQREIYFFTTILPIMTKHQMSRGAKESLKNITPIFHSSFCDGENDFIIMEDLGESGLKQLSNTASLEDRNMILRMLAHLHAVSISFRITKPEEFAKIKENLPELYYTEVNRQWYANYLKRALEVDKTVFVEELGTDSVYYKKYMQLISKDVYGELISLVNADTKHIAILHGDAWNPNFMYSQNKSIIIDYQAMRVSSPAIELVYFILICQQKYHALGDFHTAVDMYYNYMVYYLEDMGWNAEEVLSKNELIDEIKKFGRFGFLACLTSIPLQKSSDILDYVSLKNLENNLDHIPLETLWNLKPMEDKSAKTHLINILKLSVDIGLI